jgi:poly(3-hydroxybutyrate) depolymerase
MWTVLFLVCLTIQQQRQINHFVVHGQETTSSSSSTLRSLNSTTNVVDVPKILHTIKKYVGIERSLQHDGLVRWFVEYPAPLLRLNTSSTSNSTSTSYSNGTVPVLIILHFGTGNMQSSRVFGRTLEKDPWLQLAEQYGYLVLSPNAARSKRNGMGYETKRFFGNDWNDYYGGRNQNVAKVDDVGFLSALVEWSIQNRNGDRSRIYIAGFSNGGTMVQRMIVERPTLFAATAAYAANLPDFDVPLPTHGTPLLLMFGTEDARMPYNGGKTSGNRGLSRSAEATRDFFLLANGVVALNNATASSTFDVVPNVTILTDNDPNDNCRIVSEYYHDSKKSNNTLTTAPVQFYKMSGGGHNFAGNFSFAGYNAPKIVVDFIELLLGNNCRDASGIKLGWEFMTRFQRTN